MNSQLSGRLLVLLSMAYGIGLAIMAILDLPGLSTVAAIGGMLIGLLWVARAVLSGKKSAEGS